MNNEEFERLNSLSEKAMNNIASPNELKAFSQLLNIWNESIEYNLFQSSYLYNSKDLPS